MYHFQINSGLDLYNDSTPVMTNISPWFNPVLKLKYAHLCDGIFHIALKNGNKKSAIFESEDGQCTIELTLKEAKNNFAIFASMSYSADGYPLKPTHLSPMCGFGFDFDLNSQGNMADMFMGCTFWQRPKIIESLSELKPRTQALFYENELGQNLLFTTCHNAFKTEIFPNESRASLKAHSNCILDKCKDECILIGGHSDSVYSLSEQVCAYGLKVMKKKGKLRKDKEYPEVFEYLGWCSWDAFHMDVTEDLMLKKASEFKQKDIPVKWAIFDDMWAEVKNNNLDTFHQRELYSWEADPQRFPGGLKRAIEKLKEEYQLKIGIWHPINGYWHGIDPGGELAKNEKELLEYTVARDSYEPRLAPSFDKRKSDIYFTKQYRFYKNCGADFIKADNQGNTENLSYLKYDISTATKSLHSAVEGATKKFFDKALINCMGMPIENYWNRGDTNVNRFSGDFQPENRQWFANHLLQCSFNSLCQGALYTGDWDMWWSDDGQAKKNSVIRSLSGGPIYLSDELGRSIRDVIMPTVLSDGRILRADDPAVPTADCIYTDCTKEKKAFKIFNKIGEGVALAAFNIHENEEEVTATVDPLELCGMKKGEFALYDWFADTLTVIEEGFEIKLKNYDDFKLYIIIPIIHGKAVIGLKEKYLSPATVRNTKEGTVCLDDGTLCVISKKPIEGFAPMGMGIYQKKVTKGELINL
ncbi:MAG: hypothetical protein E7646_07250 [Ruminococcaceae bacterium]|nr:hypothetical protein [Oscillospiraceae bacterium]